MFKKFNKRQALNSIVFLVLGLIIGVIITGIYSASTFEKAMAIRAMLELVNWENRAFQAYKEEKPEVAIWALKDLIDILKNQEKNLKRDNELIKKDLVFTYVRLALVYKKQNNTNQFQINISKAFNLAQKVFPKSFQNEEELIKFINKLDNKPKNKTNRCSRTSSSAVRFSRPLMRGVICDTLSHGRMCLKL